MGAVAEQAARHAEACRRAHPNREIPEGEPGHDLINQTAGLHLGPNTMSSGDTWSSGGMMPGVETPDLQGPEQPFGPPVTPVPNIDIGGANLEDIVRSPLGGRR
jgi:hypothetical protein